jgi:glycosyl transferase, family 25
MRWWGWLLLVLGFMALMLLAARVYIAYINWQYRRACRKLAALPVDREDIQRKLGGVPLYYVNCNAHTQRRAHMEDKAGQLGLLGGRGALRRVEGVYGRDIAPDGTYTFSDGTTLHFSTDYIAGKEFSPGECGCFCSHMRALRAAYDNGDDVALVMEDDVNLDILKVWPTTLPEIMEDAPSEWSFIQLFGHNLFEPGRFVPRTEKSYLGAVAYLVSRRGMRAVLEHVGYLREDRLVVPRTHSNFLVDEYMYDVVRESTYMTRPLLIANNLEVGSTLANRDMWLMGKSRDLGTTISSLRILNTMIPS